MPGAMNANFQSTITSPWLEMEPVRVVEVPKTLRTADGFVVVDDHDVPRMRIDLYGYNNSAFRDAIIWQGFVIIGWDDGIHFVDLEKGDAKTVNLDSYFGHLYATEKILLAASARKLFCFDGNANLQWVSDTLGVDGVLIFQIDDELISGEGEWDPPGGWRPFRVKVGSGKSV